MNIIPSKSRRSILKEISSFIKNKRITKKMSQQTLADRTYISRTTIRYFENNSGTMDIGRLVTVLDVLGYDTKIIITDKQTGEEKELLSSIEEN